MDCLDHSGWFVKTGRYADSEASAIEAGTNRRRSVFYWGLPLTVAESELSSELDRKYALPANIRNRVKRFRITLSPDDPWNDETSDQQYENFVSQFPLPPSSDHAWKLSKGLLQY